MHVCKEVEEKLISCKIGKDTHCLLRAAQILKQKKSSIK